MRVTWLPAVLRAAGVRVYELPGWRGRGRSMPTVHGVVGHDTVTTPAWTDARVDHLLRDGRSGLPGPLAQCGMDRTGCWRIVADGRSNHNGYGTWGNNSIGVEVYAAGGLAGHEEPWNAAQRRSFEVGTAAILAHLNLPTTRVMGHKETDPRRKVDPWGVDMSATRARIAAPTVTEEDDMLYQLVKAAGQPHIYAVGGGGMFRVPSPGHLQQLRDAGLLRSGNVPEVDPSVIAAMLEGATRV